MQYLDILWIIIGSILMFVGILGSFLPVLPGPPISWIGLLLLHFLKSDHPFTWKFLIIWAVIVAIVTVLDYVVPVWGTKKFGGSKYGNWGSTIGLIIGLFFSPLSAFTSIIIFPFIGAYIGEIIYGKNNKESLKAAFGSFVGFLSGMFMKFAVSLIMLFYFIYQGIF